VVILLGQKITFSNIHLTLLIMAEKNDAVHADAVEAVPSSRHVDLETAPPMEHIAEYQDAEHINLTWKSWMVG
jgi:hypothetical protein